MRDHTQYIKFPLSNWNISPKRINYTIKDSFLVCGTIILVVSIIKLLSVSLDSLWDNGSRTQLSPCLPGCLAYWLCQQGETVRLEEKGHTLSCLLPVYTYMVPDNSVSTIKYQSSLPPYWTSESVCTHIC